MPKLSQVFQGSFLKAEDLNGKPCNVTIESVEVKEFDDGNKLMMKFKGSDKALIVNKTNANILADVLGSDDTDDWEGKRITLEVRKVDFQGKRVPAIRVSDTLPPAKAASKTVAPPVDPADQDGGGDGYDDDLNF